MKYYQFNLQKEYEIFTISITWEEREILRRYKKEGYKIINQ